MAPPSILTGRPARQPFHGHLPGTGVESHRATTGSVAGVVQRGSLVLFLALYLLLLAFFIMLTALSSLERQRADAVMDSLSLTFAPHRLESATDLRLQDLDGDRRAAEAFIALVIGLFQSAIPAIHVEETVPGRAIEIRLRAEALFDPGTDTLRPPRKPMLDSVIAALADAPPGLRFEMAVIPEVAETQDTNGTDLFPTDGSNLALRRAGTIGRFMNDHGAAKGTIVVGIAPGDPNWMRITFRTVDVTRWDPDFSVVPADAVPNTPRQENPERQSGERDPRATLGGNSNGNGKEDGLRGAQSRDSDDMVFPSSTMGRGDESVSPPITRSIVTGTPVNDILADRPDQQGRRAGESRGDNGQTDTGQPDLSQTTGTAREQTAQ